MHPELEKSEHFRGFHTVFIGEMYYWIAQRLPLTYTVTVEQHLSTQNIFGGINRYTSDVEVSQAREPAAVYETATTITPPQFTTEIPTRPQRLLAIRGANREVITTIELLSPANKKEPGAFNFRLKQDDLAANRIHLVEIDLLRKGSRRWDDPRIEAADYVLTVLRRDATVAEAWTPNLGDPLPVLPIPLRQPDADVPLPLEHLIQQYLEKSGLGRRFAAMR